MSLKTVIWMVFFLHKTKPCVWLLVTLYDYAVWALLYSTFNCIFYLEMVTGKKGSWSFLFCVLSKLFSQLSSQSLSWWISNLDERWSLNNLNDCLKDMVSHISCALGCFLLLFTFYSGSCVTFVSSSHGYDIHPKLCHNYICCSML